MNQYHVIYIVQHAKYSNVANIVPVDLHLKMRLDADAGELGRGTHSGRAPAPAAARAQTRPHFAVRTCVHGSLIFNS